MFRWPGRPKKPFPEVINLKCQFVYSINRIIYLDVVTVYPYNGISDIMIGNLIVPSCKLTVWDCDVELGTGLMCRGLCSSMICHGFVDYSKDHRRIWFWTIFSCIVTQSKLIWLETLWIIWCCQGINPGVGWTPWTQRETSHVPFKPLSHDGFSQTTQIIWI